MSYLQQIKLLLWKNYLVKKRLPHILVLETFIPFVLFVILGLIRQHELPISINTGSIPAKALPSSGIVSVMQTFCYGESTFHFDGDGLPSLPDNSTLYIWLDKVNSVVTNHYVLFSNYTVELFDQIPSNYQEDVDHYDSIYEKLDRLSNLTRFNTASPVGGLYTDIILPNETSPKSYDTSALTNTTSDVAQKEDSDLPTVLALYHAYTERSAENTSSIVYLANFFNISNITGETLMLQLIDLAEDLDEFTKFHSTLNELSEIVAFLPLDACTDLDNNGTSNSVNKTKSKAPNYAGIVKIYQSLQPIFCPNDASNSAEETSTTTTEKTPDGDFDSSNTSSSIGVGESQLSSEVTDHFQILSNILNSNPKILYTPGNTSADLIMKQANKTFEFIDHLTLYAKHWSTNISKDLKAYLSRPDMDKKLNSIKRTQKNLISLRKFLMLTKSRANVTSFYEALSPFLALDIQNASILIEKVDLIDKAACSWVKLMSGVDLSIFVPYKNEFEATNYALYEAYKKNVTVMAIVVFEVNQTTGQILPHTSYKIRMNSTFLPSVRRIRPLYWSPQPRNWDYNYYTYGFSWIQDVVDRAIINVLVGHEVIEPGNFALNFPYPCYHTNDMILPLTMTISFVYTAAILVQNIVSEKENRLKEFMKVMGLSNAVHGMAWFITAFLQMSFAMTGVTLLLKYSKVLLHSNAFIIWLILELYAVATITFCFLVSAVFSKAKIASATAGILYFLSYVPAMYIGIREDIAGGKMPAFVKRMASFMSTSAFGLSCKYISLYESEGVGVHWDNLTLSPIEHDSFSLADAIFFMAFDAFIYSGCAWYIEHIHPGSYGIPKPWYFPFTKHYWLGTPGDDYEKPPLIAVISDWFKRLCNCYCSGLSVMEEDQLNAMNTESTNFNHFEPDPLNLTLGVEVDNLTKIYKKTGKLAVNKLSLRLYESQITGLLGHNGAGKTSTMSVLTGILPPSSGTARIYGLDIRSNLDTIRSSVGYCPQYNVLFEQLSGEEHLMFYSGLKCSSDALSRIDVNQMLEDVGLSIKKSSPVNHLSGGMKRKLSVALAFIAQSRLVILDEPTAGVDPYSRRAIWDLILKYKKGRTILLSTHHMDEADVLSDRIAIISNGRLKCCGSSIFLRNIFCDGYHLVCVKNPATFNWLETMSFVKKSIPSSFLRLESKQEMHFILPYVEEKSGQFVTFFRDLASNMTAFGIESYGIYDSTLEEAFLHITQTAQCEEGETFLRPTSRHHRQYSAGSYQSATSHFKFAQNSSQQHDMPLLNCSNQASSNLQVPGQQPRRGHHRQSSDISAAGLNSTSQRRRGHSRQSSADSVLLNVGNTAMPDKPADSTSLLSAADVFALLEGSPGPSSSSGSPNYAQLCSAPPRFLHLKHFRALMIKRFLYVRRNWKVLFSQVFLPAIFVSIAMSMALSAPNMDDPPPLLLSPAQYYNYTRPRGLFVPVSNYASRPGHKPTSVVGTDGWTDAGPEELVNTLHLPSGLAATCVLRSPDIYFDPSRFNFSHRDYQLLEQYFNKDCASVFVKGVFAKDFLPPPPTKAQKTTTVNYNLFETTTTTSSTPTSTSPSYGNTTTEPHELLFYPICQCSDDSSGFYCPNDYIKPPEFQLITSDYIVDIGYQNMSEYALYTTDEYRLHRYGALTFGQELSHIPESFGNGLPTEFRRLAIRRVGVFSFNHRGFHSMPAYLNALNNAILRANLHKRPEVGNPAAYGITVYNHPINGTDKIDFQDMATQGTDTMIAVFIIIAMSFVPASFVVFLVYERSLLSKHTQLMAGLHPVTYWVTNYTWDLLNYLIPSTCCIIILAAFDIPAYTEGQNFPAIVILFLLYGWSVTPMMYPFSFYLNDPSAAYIILVVINLFVGTTCLITSFLLDLFHNSEILAAVHSTLKVAFLFSPSYCLGRGLMDVAINQYRNEFYVLAGQPEKIASPFAWETTMRSYIVMFCEGFIFFGLTLVLEYVSGVLWSGSLTKSASKKRRTWTPPSMRDSMNEDPDVVAERHRVLSGDAADDLLIVDGLTKEYSTRAGRLLAVDRLTLGLSSGECFGLLGLNGAGKSTTFSMLTGVLNSTAGEARVSGDFLCGGHRPSSRVMQSVGYCPQTDPLLDELTAREHLQLYARIRAIPSAVQPQIVTWLLERMGLELYADKPSRTFSGGTKRKLSAALALLGNPTTILLDEPTTGMDPGSRRFLWNLILELRHENRLVVLTSHSMEECEALCSRLGVMVAGKMRCLGSTQQLKSKFGKGYSIIVRLPSHYATRSRSDYNADPSEIINKSLIKAGFESSTWRIIARRHQIMEIAILNSLPDLSLLFKIFGDLRQEKIIADFSISQNTLDSVFLQLARDNGHLQIEAHEKIKKKKNKKENSGSRNNSVRISDPSTVVWADDELVEERDDELLIDPDHGSQMRLEIVA